MLNFLFYFIAFPSRKDALIASHLEQKRPPIIEASGSLGLYYNKKCHQTYPNETITENAEFDWCSNIGSSDEDQKPWIMYSFKNEKMVLSSVSIRNGCCYHACCCVDDQTLLDYECCCLLYSFSVKASNDNHTWVTLLKQEKVKDFWGCKFMNFEIDDQIITKERSHGGFRYIKFVMDEPYPGCRYCMQINQIELYGETNGAVFYDELNDDNDETVSIIGKIKRHDSD